MLSLKSRFFRKSNEFLWRPWKWMSAGWKKRDGRDFFKQWCSHITNNCFTHGASSRSFLAYALGGELQVFCDRKIHSRPRQDSPGRGSLQDHLPAVRTWTRIKLLKLLHLWSASGQQCCHGPKCPRPSSSLCQYLRAGGLLPNPMWTQQGGWFAAKLPNQFGEVQEALPEPETYPLALAGTKFHAHKSTWKRESEPFVGTWLGKHSFAFLTRGRLESCA